MQIQEEHWDVEGWAAVIITVRDGPKLCVTLDNKETNKQIWKLQQNTGGRVQWI